MEKRFITASLTISKEDDSEISQELYRKIVDAIEDVVIEHECEVIAFWKHQTAEEINAEET